MCCAEVRRSADGVVKGWCFMKCSDSFAALVRSFNNNIVTLHYDEVQAYFDRFSFL